MTAMSHGVLAGRATISGVALALVLVLSLIVGAPSHAAGGTLSGTLTGPDLRPYELFTIDVFEADGPDRWRLATSRTVWSGDGQPPGQFAVPLPAGTYRACFSAPVEDWTEDVGRRCWSDGYEVWDATDIVIAEGATTTINPSLPAEGRLRGRIVGPGGTGVSAYVAPYRRLPNGTWDWHGGKQSQADGTFTVPDLDPGTYKVCLLDVPREFVAECWDDVATLVEAQEVAVAPNTTTPLRFRLARRASVSGTVSRPPGSTAPIYVTSYRWNGGRWAATPGGTVAGADGSYRITGLDAGTYRVCAHGYDVVTGCWKRGSSPSDGTDIPLADGASRQRLNLAPGLAGFVTGTLPDVYLGAQGYPVPVAWKEVDGSWRSIATGEAVPSGTGADWIFEVGSLPTGRYVVCVSHEDPEFVPAFAMTCNGGSPSPQGGVPFEVVAGATTSGIDIPTGRAGEINGSVASPPTRVRVDLYAPTGRLALSQWTGPDGRYRFRELPPGDYRIGFHRNAGLTPLAAEWWQNRGDGLGVAGATPIPVDGDRIIGIRATLDPGGAIDGRLLDSAGAPVAGCTVRARARDNSLAVRTAVTDATGAFSIGGLSTASYVVLVPNTCSGEPSWIYYDTDSADGTTARLRDADDIAVTRGRTTALAVDLQTNG